MPSDIRGSRGRASKHDRPRPSRRRPGRRRPGRAAARSRGGSHGDGPGRTEPAVEYEVEVLEGLTPLARREAEANGLQVTAEHADGFRATGPVEAVLGLRLAAAAYRRLAFGIPRPKALLGDQNLRRLVAALRETAGTPPTFRGFRLAAAGAESAVFRRLGDELERASGLAHRPEDGELLVRVRPVPDGPGWEALLRLTPRPLSARAWRVCNRAGGLNASLAAAMVRLAGVGPDDRYLNLMCGSGTLLVERFLAGPAASSTGVDVDEEALDCARANLRAAGAAGACRLVRADVRDAPLAPSSYDVVTVDLPWGDAVGTHQENARLHPAVLEAADRLGAPGVRLVVLTHELRLFDRLLRSQDRWRIVEEWQVAHGGHHPRMLLLARS